MEDDNDGSQIQWYTTPIEDDLASMEDDLKGRQPQWKVASMEDELNER